MSENESCFKFRIEAPCSSAKPIDEVAACPRCRQLEALIETLDDMINEMLQHQVFAGTMTEQQARNLIMPLQRQADAIEPPLFKRPPEDKSLP